MAEVQVLQVLPLLHGAASMDRSLEVVLAVIAGNSRAECYGYVPVSLEGLLQMHYKVHLEHAKGH